MTIKYHLPGKLNSVVLFSALILFGHFFLIFAEAIQAGEPFQEIDVTRTFNAEQGLMQCKTGTAKWDGQKLVMKNTANGNCMIPISTGKLEDFRVIAKVSVDGGNNYSAGIFYGGLDGVASLPGSIFFTKTNMFGMMTVEGFQSQVEGTKTLFSIPAFGSSKDIFLLELTKVGKRYRFSVNGTMVADWNDTVSREYTVWLVLSSFGVASQGGFQDFKVYNRGASAKQDTVLTEIPDMHPDKDQPTEERTIQEDEWSDL